MRKHSTARSRTEVPKPGRAPGRPAGTDGVGGGCPDSTRRRRGPYVATTYVLVSSRREKPPPLAGGGETRQAPPPEESEGEAWKGGGGGESEGVTSARDAGGASGRSGVSIAVLCAPADSTSPRARPSVRERERVERAGHFLSVSVSSCIRHARNFKRRERGKTPSIFFACAHPPPGLLCSVHAGGPHP
jgi:hypothetical protein